MRLSMNSDLEVYFKNADGFALQHRWNMENVVNFARGMVRLLTVNGDLSSARELERLLSLHDANLQAMKDYLDECGSEPYRKMLERMGWTQIYARFS